MFIKDMSSDEIVFLKSKIMCLRQIKFLREYHINFTIKQDMKIT